MSYIDAYYDRHNDRILISEKIDGVRQTRSERCNHVFYYEHPAGSSRSIYGDSCRRFSTPDHKKFARELKAKRSTGAKIFESDIRPEFRFLEDHYKGGDAPTLNVCFFDIETGFDPVRGYAPVENPFNPVTSITFWLGHLEKMVTVALVPPTLTMEEGQDIADKFENTMVFDDEAEMLKAFLDLTEDVDLFSGWNSEGYDIPYLVNRVKMIMDENELKKLCLFGLKPRLREYLRFGRKSITYDLIGKVHLDYLLLYQKHNPQQQHSYKLDFISEIEVGDNKTPYDGTLEDLYRNDFEKFIDYNRQDVMLLVKIDRKKKFIELSNQIAHANCVTLKTTMGSVALVEQAIICEMHDMGLVVPERKETDDQADYGEIQLDEFGFEVDEEDFVFEDKEKPPVVGAYVSKPKTGIHHYIACMDINSLYPSVIRALNMSPETIVGQIRSDRTKALVEGRIAAKVKRADAWEGIFRTLEVDSILGKTDEMVTLDLDNGDSMEITGAQAYQIIYGPGSNLCMTANGTIFRTDVDGIIPQLLAKWYSDRKSMQAKEAFYGELRAGIPVTPEQEAILCG